MTKQIETVHIQTSSKDIVKKYIFSKETLQDYDVNFSWYTLQQNQIFNGAGMPVVKLKPKMFKQLVKDVEIVNYTETLKRYENITIFKNFKRFDINGNGLYNIQVFASDTKNELIMNISHTVKEICRLHGMKYRFSNNIITGYDTDDIHIKYLLNRLSMTCKRGY